MAFIKFMLSGYGGEVALGKITKKCAEFWLSEEMRDYLLEYASSPDWFPDEYPNIKIPKYAQLSNWYEHDDRGHEYGVAESMAQLDIIEMDGLDWSSNEVKDIYYGGLEDFVFEYQEITPDNDMVNVDYVTTKGRPTEYTLAGVHTEKGTFYEGTIEIEGEFDPTKVSFDVMDIHEERLVTNIYYDGEMVDNIGGSTTGKSLDIDIIEPWEE